MATHSSILAWRIPTDRGAWRATVHQNRKDSETMEHSRNGRARLIPTAVCLTPQDF